MADPFYERALELAERGRGKTGHRPVVGAVVVRGGDVVGEGWYEEELVRHAEPAALEQAGEKARGATLFVAGSAIFGSDDLADAYHRLARAVA